MLSTIRRYFASCKLDRRHAAAGLADAGHPDRVHRLLSEPAPLHQPSPALRSRIMHALRESPSPQPGPRWRWAGAALACLLVTAAGLRFLSPAPAPTPVHGPLAGLSFAADPMFRLVESSMDKPMMDQAQKMYDDTRRATRVVVRCVPFVRRGG